jgi:hypothetical protein
LEVGKTFAIPQISFPQGLSNLPFEADHVKRSMTI